MHPIELNLISLIIEDALALGYSIAVWDGEDFQYTGTDPAEILLATAVSDETTYFFFTQGASIPFGQVFFVHGNEEDVISDASDNPRVNAILERAMAST